MRSIVSIASVCIFLLSIVLAPAAVAGSAPQEGTATTCADYNALWVFPGLELGPRVEVDGTETFVIQSDIGTPFVDFFDAEGNWVGGNGGTFIGVVPWEAAYGIVCVGATGGYPDAPLVVASYTYYDY